MAGSDWGWGGGGVAGWEGRGRGAEVGGDCAGVAGGLRGGGREGRRDLTQRTQRKSTEIAENIRRHGCAGRQDAGATGSRRRTHTGLWSGGWTSKLGRVKHRTTA